MINLIYKSEAKEYYNRYVHYNRKNESCPCCGEIIDNENVIAVESETNINGADVPTLNYFCSVTCAKEWLNLK